MLNRGSLNWDFTVRTKIKEALKVKKLNLYHENNTCEDRVTICVSIHSRSNFNDM